MPETGTAKAVPVFVFSVDIALQLHEFVRRKFEESRRDLEKAGKQISIRGRRRGQFGNKNPLRFIP